MIDTLKTYQDFLRENDLPDEGLFDCPQQCGTMPQPSFALVEIEPGMWSCSNCHIERQRREALREELKERARLEAENPWLTEQGAQMKAERNALLEQSNWAIQVDSPLSEKCKALFVLYRKALNRLTVDYNSPLVAVMPEPPELEYE